jgi:hypothetical protein
MSRHKRTARLLARAEQDLIDAMWAADMNRRMDALDKAFDEARKRDAEFYAARHVELAAMRAGLPIGGAA